MSRHRTPGWTLASAALMLAFSASSAPAQSLLVIPDLSRGVDTIAVKQSARRDYMKNHARVEQGGRRDTTGVAAYVQQRVEGVLEPNRWGADLLGEMSPDVSKMFWGEARSSILPGSSIGLGSGSAAIYTEVGHVLSGIWRFSVGTTIAIAEEEEDDASEVEAQQETNTTPLGLDRFIAGGGSLSLQALRPIWLFQTGTYNHLGVIAAPRVWANIPQLTSAENVDDYGWEAAASVLYQRHRNEGGPFLTVEVRGGLAAGSTAFYEGIGHDEASKFVYLAPTFTISVVDQVNIGASYFWSPDLDSPGGIRLNLSLLNRGRKEEPTSQGTPRREGTQPGGR